MDTIECQTELTESLFANRRDIYAVENDDGSWRLVKQPLTSEVLSRHSEGRLTAGVYQLDEMNQVKWLCLDFDDKDAENNAAKVFAHIRGTAYADAALLEHTGGRGYHVWVFFSNMIPAGQAKKIAEKLVEEAGVQCEVYPKQIEIWNGGYGNLVRLPLGIHKKTGKRSTLIEPENLSEVVPFLVEPEQGDGNEEHDEDDGDGLHNRGKEVLPCWQRMLQGVHEGCRMEVAFAITRRLRSTFGFDEELCVKSLIEWNKRNSPPMHEREIVGCVHDVFNEEYPSIGCNQIMSHGLLNQFCDKDCCPWKINIDQGSSKRPPSLLANNSPHTDCNVTDYMLRDNYWLLVVDTLGNTDLTILRYNDTVAADAIKANLKRIESRDYWTEETLLSVCGVRCILTPYNQTIVISHATFIGKMRILNRKRGVMCSQLVWYVRFLHVEGAEVKESWPGLLQITPKRFEEAGFDDPVSAFPGICVITADVKRRIVGAETDFERRILNG